MFRLLKLEFLKAYRQRSLVWGIALCCGFLLIAAVTQNSQLDRAREKVEQNQAVFTKKQTDALADLALVESGEKSYDSLWDDPRGYYTWHEFATQLSIRENAFWAVGQRDLFEDFHISGIYKPARVAAKAVSNPLPMLWGQFDPAFVLVFLMPLFLIGLGFRLIGEESTKGTLPLVLSQPISSRRFFFMKAAVWFLPFLLGILATVGIAQAWNAGIGSLAKADFLILLIAVSLYAIFWLLVTLLLCRFCSTSSLAALGSIMLWVVLVVVLPKTVATLSTQVRPLPQRVLLTGALREATRTTLANANKVLERYYQDHPELGEQENLTVEASHKRFFDFYQKSLSVSLAADAEMKPLMENYYQQRTGQQQFERTMSMFLPPAMFQQILEIVAGSSSKDRLDFAQQVDGFSLGWRQHFQRLAFEKRLISSEGLAQFPTFEFKRQSQAPLAQKFNFIMLLMNLVLLGFAWFSFKKIPLRKG